MPRVVDQDQKRADIARAAYEVIVRDGLRGATMRSIARAAGCSTGMVVHYFHDRQDVLMHAHHHAARDVRARMQTHERQRRGIGVLSSLIDETLPVDERRRNNWRVWIAFWDESIANAELATEQSKRVTEWRRRIRRGLDQAKEDGEIPCDLDLVEETERIASLVEGLAIQVVIHGRRIPASRQYRIIEEYMNRLQRPSLTPSAQRGENPS